MATFTLCCCVIALPILVLGYNQEWKYDEKPANTASVTEQKILKSERGWIGCLYNSKVCEKDERCVDDNLFGVCRSRGAGISPSTLLYKFKDLNADWKRILEKEMMMLARDGYKWTDVYTQCILRSSLLSYRSGSLLDASICRVGLNRDANKYSQSEEEPEPELEPEPEPEESANRQGSLMANEATNADQLADILERTEEKKRDAAVKLHKYFDRQARLNPTEEDYATDDYEDETPNDEQDYIDEDDIARLRQQLQVLKSLQEDAQSSLDNDNVDDLKTEQLDDSKEEPQNDDLTMVATLVRNKVGSGDKETKRSAEMGHAHMKSTAENMSPEEALSELRPSKRFRESHIEMANAERARMMAEKEAQEEEELEAVTSKPIEVDSRWVFVNVGWPKGGPQQFTSKEQVREFLDAIEKSIGVSAPLYDRFEYSDREVDFHLTKPLQENPQAIVALLKNVTQPIPGGPVILGSGLGRETRKVPAAKLAPKPKHFGVTFAVCGAVLFIIIAVIIVFFMQRYRISKSKVYSLTKAAEQGESREAYQDLCRHRMQSRSSEKPEPLSAAARAVGPALTRGDSNSAGSTRSSTSSWSEEPIHSNMDISTGHLILSYMEEHLNNKEKLESEWNNLCAYQPDVVKCDIGKREENLNRNRYLDNIPYDNNRVELKTAFEGSTYFNASYVINHDPKNPVYIVTQGPLANTAAQFWQMVWEQGSIVIVNLTRLVEDGISLCQKYWPEEGSELYNNYEVHLVSEHVWCEDYLVRSFYLKNVSTGETRTVTQFHFLSWPDLGEPNAVKTLLDFRRKVNKSYKGRSCPVVVHCSDGCGRSGTYILLDMVLNRLAKGVKEIDISAAVEHLRDQRCQMVKTKGQFEFVLTAIAEEVHAMLKSLPQ